VQSLFVFMPSPLKSVGEGIMFLGCPVCPSFCPPVNSILLFVCLSSQILLPRYIMNRLNSFDKTEQGIFASPYWWPHCILDVRGQRWMSQQAVEIIYHVTWTTLAILVKLMGNNHLNICWSSKVKVTPWFKYVVVTGEVNHVNAGASKSIF